MTHNPGKERTCNACGWVAFGVTRAFAEDGVRRFNEYIDSADEATREMFGNRRSSIANYERCHRCGGPHTNFRVFQIGDCPTGVTMQPIIVDGLTSKADYCPFGGHCIFDCRNSPTVCSQRTDR